MCQFSQFHCGEKVVLKKVLLGVEINGFRLLIKKSNPLHHMQNKEQVLNV